jgi:hypothetical protein
MRGGGIEVREEVAPGEAPGEAGGEEESGRREGVAATPTVSQTSRSSSLVEQLPTLRPQELAVWAAGARGLRFLR